ncbi:aspartate aminotransferase [Fodinibius salinus]|uniref:Aminotransferase n=1 Tax=Fodinibius salinus TaxID=860790 RepID=A0A5D3YJK7_9BACT|nr:pyridoxal phosphate-dependent aminotransferase [Fodinibius salinus]TYP93953.1 aspartate aminotransferase [Fodinibius salinus]
MISSRAQSVAPSATLAISDKAKELKEEGKSIISLSAGEPDFNTPKHICQAAINAINNGFHGYTMNTGTPGLRKSITNKLQRDNNLSYSPSQIVCTNGAKQALGFSMLAMIDEGDEVIIPAPYWVSYPQMVNVADGTPVTVRTSFDNNYRITAQQLKDAITEQTKAVMLCSPSNPTGTCYSREELKALADVLDDHPQVNIISDEIYEYIVFEDEHVGILNVAPQLKERTVLINGFSKGFAMTGWRLGYLAAPQDFTDAVAKIQSQETSAPSAISQKAGEAAYRGSLDAVTKMREAFKKRRDYIVGALSEIEGVKCFTPSGAFYVFPDISHYFGRSDDNGTTIESSTELCMYLIEQHGLAAVPGDAFGEPNGIRLSYAAGMDQLKEAISRLKKGLQELS